jgi:hypothetical protein
MNKTTKDLKSEFALVVLTLHVGRTPRARASKMIRNLNTVVVTIV